MRGRFIVVEGGAGCGAAEQAGRLAARLEAAGYETTDAGSGGRVAAELAAIAAALDPAAALFAAAADVAETAAAIVAPALERGRVVVAGRWLDAWRVDLVAGGRAPAYLVDDVARLVAARLEPDLVVVVDRTAEAARGARPDAEPLEAFERRRRAYHAIAARDLRDRYWFVDGDGDEATVADRVWMTVRRYLDAEAVMPRAIVDGSHLVV